MICSYYYFLLCVTRKSKIVTVKSLNYVLKAENRIKFSPKFWNEFGSTFQNKFILSQTKTIMISHLRCEMRQFPLSVHIFQTEMRLVEFLMLENENSRVELSSVTFLDLIDCNSHISHCFSDEN